MKYEFGGNKKLGFINNPSILRHTKIFIFKTKSKQNLYIFYITSQIVSANNLSEPFITRLPIG